MKEKENKPAKGELRARETKDLRIEQEKHKSAMKD